jgi:ABC-type nickel/cobalt efflux system permease component RcnA
VRRIAALTIFTALSLAAFFAWRMGVLASLRVELVEAQRAFQSVLAGGVRALKAGEPGAALTLIGLGFLYGVLHAAGPGHGKVVLGAWAFSARARLIKIASITLLASLAQSLVAIGLVLGGAWLFGLGRADLTALSDEVIPQIGDRVLVALGAWLILRAAWGMWQIWRAKPAAHHSHAHDHGDHHGDHGSCGCGHAHAPSPEAAARASLPEAVLLIAGIALRPCTGAVFVMLLTVLIGAPAVGALSVLAMGMGTALITLAVAMISANLGSRALAPSKTLTLRIVAALAQAAVGVLVVVLYF